MLREVEAELMDTDGQSQAYTEADFGKIHDFLMRYSEDVLGIYRDKATVMVDLGCGGADIAVRLCRRYPKAHILAIEGATSMLKYAKSRLMKEGVHRQVCLIQAVLPHIGEEITGQCDAAISNSLLHHLHDPQVLWNTIKTVVKPCGAVFISDLCRPYSDRLANKMVDRYAADQSPILQRDFFRSLKAAFTANEVKEQLVQAGLAAVLRVSQVDDRHLVIRGRLPSPAYHKSKNPS